MTDKELCERLRAEEHWAIERSEAELKREAADRIEELETQNEGYNLALAEQLQIRQELEAWKAAEEAHHHMLRQELASLTAEVDRLREALEESWALNVNYHAVEEPDGYQFTEAPAVIEIARAALEGTSHE